MLEPNHCDLHIVKDNNEDKQTESQDNVVVKVECYEAMCVDEDKKMEVKTEDDYLIDKATADCVVSREEYSVFDNSAILDAKLLDESLQKALRSQAVPSSSIVAARVSRIQDRMKTESATYNCSLCFEEFFLEHEYNRHMSMHLPSGDVAGGSEPAAARSSLDSGHKSVSTGTVRRPPAPPHTHAAPAAHVPPATVAHSAAKLANRQQINLMPTEELKVHESSEDDLDDESCGSTNKTNTDMKRYTNCVVKELEKSLICDNLVTISIDSHCKPASENEVTATENKSNVSTARQSNCSISDINIIPLSNSSGHNIHTQCTEKICFTCDVCGNIYKRRNNLVQHMKTHASVKPYSCTLCNHKCIQKCHLVRHMRTHTGEKPYSCQLCNYKCARNYDLAMHMRTHTGENLQSCEVCNYKCAYKSQLVIHMRSHTGEKPYSCTLCDNKFVSKGHLAYHMGTHTDEKPYSCALCNYKCAHKSHLVSHMKTHSGKKPYSCELCDYKCARNYDLVMHMRTHTGEKPHSCELCNYKCVHKSQLVVHMRTHTGEKPFSCELCNYKCRQKSILENHMRTHTGEKPYSCKLCYYKSTQNYNLVQHMRTHTGVKPYSCTLCNYKCARNCNLLRHIRTHTGET